MMTLAVRMLCLSLALCVAVSSGASGPSVNHVPTHGPDYRLGLSDIMNQYQQFGSAPANYFINPLDFDAKEGRVVVGAADKLYLLNKDTLVMEGEVTITPDSSAVTSCRESYEDFVCQNHIRIYTKSVASDDVLVACGSGSGDGVTTSMCRTVDISGTNFALTGSSSVGGDRLVSVNPFYGGFGGYRKLNSDDDDVFLSSSVYSLNGRNPAISYYRLSSEPDGTPIAERSLTANSFWLNFWVSPCQLLHQSSRL